MEQRSPGQSALRTECLPPNRALAPLSPSRGVKLPKPTSPKKSPYSASHPVKVQPASLVEEVRAHKKREKHWVWSWGKEDSSLPSYDADRDRFCPLTQAKVFNKAQERKAFELEKAEEGQQGVQTPLNLPEISQSGKRGSSMDGGNRKDRGQPGASRISYQVSAADEALTLEILKAIVLREEAIKKLQALAKHRERSSQARGRVGAEDSATGRASEEERRDIAELCSHVREVGLSIAELILQWQQRQEQGMSGALEKTVDIVRRDAETAKQRDRPVPFLWEGTNYLQKMASDLDFLLKVAKLQLGNAEGEGTPTTRNPFLVPLSLDYFQREALQRLREGKFLSPFAYPSLCFAAVVQGRELWQVEGVDVPRIRAGSLAILQSFDSTIYSSSSVPLQPALIISQPGIHGAPEPPSSSSPGRLCPIDMQSTGDVRSAIGPMQDNPPEELEVRQQERTAGVYRMEMKEDQKSAIYTPRFLPRLQAMTEDIEKSKKSAALLSEGIEKLTANLADVKEAGKRAEGLVQKANMLKREEDEINRKLKNMKRELGFRLQEIHRKTQVRKQEAETNRRKLQRKRREERERQHRRRMAATRIQATYRGYRTRKIVRKRWLLETAMARKIQRTFRTYIDRRNTLRHSLSRVSRSAQESSFSIALRQARGSILRSRKHLTREAVKASLVQLWDQDILPTASSHLFRVRLSSSIASEKVEMVLRIAVQRTVSRLSLLRISRRVASEVIGGGRLRAKERHQVSLLRGVIAQTVRDLCAAAFENQLRRKIIANSLNADYSDTIVVKKEGCMDVGCGEKWADHGREPREHKGGPLDASTEQEEAVDPNAEECWAFERRRQALLLVADAVKTALKAAERRTADREADNVLLTGQIEEVRKALCLAVRVSASRSAVESIIESAIASTLSRTFPLEPSSGTSLPSSGLEPIESSKMTQMVRDESLKGMKKHELSAHIHNLSVYSSYLVEEAIQSALELAICQHQSGRTQDSKRPKRDDLRLVPQQTPSSKFETHPVNLIAEVLRLTMKRVVAASRKEGQRSTTKLAFHGPK